MADEPIIRRGTADRPANAAVPANRGGRDRRAILAGAVRTAPAASRARWARPAHRASLAPTANLAPTASAATRVPKGQPEHAARPGHAASKVHAASRGPPGQLPSIEQVMPWLHMIFDAWEDYRQKRDQDTAMREALAMADHAEELDVDPLDDDEGDHKDKKRKKHKDRK